jgi:16S rRNA (cytosine967-C5)-methyltransferase
MPSPRKCGHRVITGREVALRVLQKALKGDTFISGLLESEFSAHRLSLEERRLATELAYGCVRRRGTLDWVIERRAGRKMAEISQALRDILRMGVYQIVYLDRVPAYAAVNETVELARAHGPSGSVKFVNALLRNTPRDLKDILTPQACGSWESYLSVAHSHPLWLVKRWVQRWGSEAAEKLCCANNAAPPMTVRTNVLKCSRDELIKQLRAEGVRAVAHEGHRLAVTIAKLPRPLRDLDSFRGGLFQVQDISAMRVVDILGPRRGETVVDVCAAPGGKATAIAETIGDEGKVLCMDVSAKKVKKIEQNARRLGLKSIYAVVGDGRDTRRFLGGGVVDRVLVDAPCSNTGVLGRRPEARWRVREADLQRLAGQQLDLVSSGAAIVGDQGIVVYSTCSIEPEENEGVVTAFLNRFKDFGIEKELRFFPRGDGGDGGYVVRLVHGGVRGLRW